MTGNPGVDAMRISTPNALDKRVHARYDIHTLQRD